LRSASEAGEEADAAADTPDSTYLTADPSEEEEHAVTAEAAHMPSVRKHMAAYIVFDGTCGADPRTASLGEVADALCGIIEVEGPILARRAYDIYLHGCGIRRLGAELKRTLNKALTSAIRQRRVISEKHDSTSGLIHSTVRLASTPAINLRFRGPRTLEEIPPGELCEAAALILKDMNVDYGSDEHLRSVLECFDLKRLTAQTSAVLLRALKRQQQPEVPTLFDQREATSKF